MKWEIWIKGIIAAAISGGANGVVTGFAAIGIDPGHFNLTAGLNHTLAIGGVSAAISAVLGVALYLRQSPLPPPDDVSIAELERNDPRFDRDIRKEAQQARRADANPNADANSNPQS
jgi:hypothetical protein